METTHQQTTVQRTIQTRPAGSVMAAEVFDPLLRAFASIPLIPAGAKVSIWEAYLPPHNENQDNELQKILCR